MYNNFSDIFWWHNFCCLHNSSNNNNNNNSTALEQQLLHFALLDVATHMFYHFLNSVHIHHTPHFVCTLFATIIMSIFHDLFIFICAYAVCKTKRSQHGEESRERGENITRWLTRIAFVRHLATLAVSHIELQTGGNYSAASTVLLLNLCFPLQRILFNFYFINSLFDLPLNKCPPWHKTLHLCFL